MRWGGDTAGGAQFVCVPEGGVLKWACISSTTLMPADLSLLLTLICLQESSLLLFLPNMFLLNFSSLSCDGDREDPMVCSSVRHHIKILQMLEASL